MPLNEYCKFLNLPDTFFNKEQLMDDLKDDLVTYNNGAGRHWRNWGYQNTPFNQQAIDWVSSLGCVIANAEVFYTKPGGTLPWHVDMNPPDPISKINFVWGSTDHLMEFGDIKNPEVVKPAMTTKVNSHYISYEASEITNITPFVLDKPALLNVGRPHRVINNSNTGRWCLCLILFKNNRRIMWDDALSLFSEYVLD
jgi:hypothetical protein